MFQRIRPAPPTAPRERHHRGLSAVPLSGMIPAPAPLAGVTARALRLENEEAPPERGQNSVDACPLYIRSEKVSRSDAIRELAEDGRCPFPPRVSRSQNWRGLVGCSKRPQEFHLAAKRSHFLHH